MNTDRDSNQPVVGSLQPDGYDAAEWVFVPALRIVGIGFLVAVDWRLAVAYVTLAFAEFANIRRRQ